MDLAQPVDLAFVDCEVLSDPDRAQPGDVHVVDQRRLAVVPEGGQQAGPLDHRPEAAERLGE